MTAKVVRSSLAGVGTKTLCIEPGSPWENGYCESFNGKLRDECLKLGDLLQPQGSVIEQWRNQYNTIRPHSSLGYRHLCRGHPQANQSTWIAMLQSSNLHLLGPKNPSGHAPGAAFTKRTQS
jgi:putative transposase